MLVHCSINHTESGRKKSVAKRFNKLKSKGVYRPKEPYRRETPKYPSKQPTAHVAAAADTGEKLAVSSRYTIAPAYNKGAYQVISLDNVKDIGK